MDLFIYLQLFQCLFNFYLHLLIVVYYLLYISNLYYFSVILHFFAFSILWECIYFSQYYMINIYFYMSSYLITFKPELLILF
jgi:hypothetical protein